nr:hypothetical protein [Tanacetum cinerariifolium]
MAKFDSGFISDLNAVRDNIILRVRIIRLWMQALRTNPNVINMELIIMDEQGAKMHATVRMKLVSMFKQQLNEDVIGQVIESPELDNYGGNGKQGKKKPLKLMDLEGTKLNCMLWGDYADQFTEALNLCDDVGLLIVVIQLGKMKKWDGVMQVQNAFFSTKLFMHNGNESILNNDSKEIVDFRQGPDAEQSANTASKISTASKFSTLEEFLTKYKFRNIDELIDLPKSEVSVIVATVILIQEEEGWWYLGCRSCNKKMVRGDEVLDQEDKDTLATIKGTNSFWCKTCDEACSSVVTRRDSQVIDPYVDITNRVPSRDVKLPPSLHQSPHVHRNRALKHHMINAFKPVLTSTTSDGLDFNASMRKVCPGRKLINHHTPYEDVNLDRDLLSPSSRGTIIDQSKNL